MNFSPTYKLESKSCPGVTITLRRMGPKRRAEVELSVSAARAKCRQASADQEKANALLQVTLDAIPEYRAKCLALPVDATGNRELTPELIGMITPEAWEASLRKSEAEQLRTSIDAAEIKPAMVLSAVESIDGLTTEDGKPYTAAMLCDAGPDELFAEVVQAVNENAYLSTEKASNLSLPTTPGAQESGTATTMTAQPAKPADESTSA